MTAAIPWHPCGVNTKLSKNFSAFLSGFRSQSILLKDWLISSDIQRSAAELFNPYWINHANKSPFIVLYMIQGKHYGIENCFHGSSCLSKEIKLWKYLISLKKFICFICVNVWPASIYACCLFAWCQRGQKRTSSDWSWSLKWFWGTIWMLGL